MTRRNTQWMIKLKEKNVLTINIITIRGSSNLLDDEKEKIGYDDEVI